MTKEPTAPLTPDQRRQRWIDDYMKIKNDAIFLVTNHHFLKELVDLAQNSPIAHEGSYFWQWVMDTYYTAAPVIIRRISEGEPKGDQAKRERARERTYSLGLLLSDIRDHNQLISFDWFKRQYPSNWKAQSDWPADARRDFDTWCGNGATCLPRRIVEQDLADLENQVRPVKDYVDQYIAHRDREPRTAAALELDRFRGAVKTIETITQRYGVLLTGTDYVLKGTIVAWQSIFQRAWIDDPRQRRPNRARPAKENGS